MGMIKIPKQSIQFYKENFDEIIESGFLAEGKWNKQLSKYTSEVTRAKCAVPTNSNGAGIVSLLQIYSHYFNRKNVLIQSNTMYGVKTMVPSGGCKLDGYINCKLNTLMPNLDDIKASIHSYSKQEKEELIVFLTHIGGIINPDIEEIAKLCKDENIVLIEDCAHSLGATLNEKHSGLFGDAGVYSFYSTKAIMAGEGGIIVTNNEEIGQMASDFSIYDRFKQKLEIGFNNRVSEVQALFTYSILKEWKHIVNNKIEIAKHYIDVCNDLNISYIDQYSNGQKGNYYKFTIFNSEKQIPQFLPNLKTTTSQVYDYSIGTNNPLANHHACLPIWYGQEIEITKKVVAELYDSIRDKI